MILLVIAAHAGLRALCAAWLDPWGEAAAGVTIAVTGVLVSVLGI